MLHHGIIGRMQIHEQWLDLTNKQFNYQELSAILYFLYTNKLNPEFYRGRKKGNREHVLCVQCTVCIGTVHVSETE